MQRQKLRGGMDANSLVPLLFSRNFFRFLKLVLKTLYIFVKKKKSTKLAIFFLLFKKGLIALRYIKMAVCKTFYFSSCLCNDFNEYL